MPEAQVSELGSAGFKPGYRPLVRRNKDGEYEFVTNQQGYVQMRSPRGLQVNSILRKDEWEELDRAVVEAVHQELNIVQDLRDAGLVQQLGGLGTMVSQVSVASERTAASVSMSGRTQGARDRVDKKQRSFPVPIIHAEYEVGIRELEASRRLGDALDDTEAREAGQVVGEKLESIAVDGESSIVISGAGIDGLTSISGRDTDTASNYGGGDFGTAGNGPKTVLGQISALAALNYRGPFGVYVANTQYWQLLTPFSNRDGNDLMDIENIPQVRFVKRNDTLAAGECVVVQLTKNVIDVAIAAEVMNREWRAEDEMAFYGKVMGAMVVRLKTDHAGNLGVSHATGA